VDLIQLIQKLVDDPEELEAFKAEPEAYIARQHESLWPYLRSLLLQHHYLETGTVMSITSRHLLFRDGAAEARQLAAGQVPPKRLDLHGVPVILRARSPFFAEHLASTQQESPEAWPGYICTLLNHSFAHAVKYGSHWVVNFSLNLCFVDPRNPNDQPQVLTLLGGDPAYQTTDYNLGDTAVYLRIAEHQYILLRGAADFVTKLGEQSSYDTETKAIHLVLDDPPHAGAA
jgi:hypothetical protein